VGCEFPSFDSDRAPAPDTHTREEAMAMNAVGWFEIYVQDMERARKFYEAVFQTRLDRLESPGIEMWAFPMLPDQAGASGALVRMEGYPSGGNSTLVYFNCADCAVEARRASEHDGAIFKDKFSIGEYGFVALVTDTEKNLIGLHSMQ
jgi:uncharacterized protein